MVEDVLEIIKAVLVLDIQFAHVHAVDVSPELAHLMICLRETLNLLIVYLIAEAAHFEEVAFVHKRERNERDISVC